MKRSAKLDSLSFPTMLASGAVLAAGAMMTSILVGEQLGGVYGRWMIEARRADGARSASAGHAANGAASAHPSNSVQLVPAAN